MFNLETFILLVSVSIKDTIIIKLNNALSTLIVVDVDCEYSACKSQCKPLWRLTILTVMVLIII